VLRKSNPSDSIELHKAWTFFLKAIENQDTKKIKETSLKNIDCALCISSDNNNEPEIDYIIPVDTFIYQSYKNFMESPVLKAIKTRGVKNSEIHISDYKPRNLPKSYGKNLILFEIVVQTYLPNEWAPGHEGQSHIFQFVKINKEFKFYGLTSIP